MNEARAAELAKREDVHPAVLDYLLTELYPDWLEMEPETTLTFLRSLTESGEPNPIVRTKVNALKVIHTTESPWEDWEVFQWVCQAFNDNQADFSNAYRPELGELYIVIETLNHLRKNGFSDEVKRWMAACGLDLGIVWSPPPLHFINDLLRMVDYRCSKCGNVDLDEDNKKCDTCGAPEEALVKYPRYVSADEIEEAWKAIQNEPIENLRLVESVKGVHLAKLAAATIAAGERRDQMLSEMDYVKG